MIKLGILPGPQWLTYNKRAMFPPGHFYSPIVDPTDPHVEQAVATEALPRDTVAGINLQESVMLRWFYRIKEQYRELPFPADSSPPSLYYYNNPFFPLADALTLCVFLRHARPRRFIEAGSGFSSCAAIDCIERKALQDILLTTFQELRANDILFLDSSHVAKTGSDVVDYLFRIFPALLPGVVIHVHDIFFPFEYPRSWIVAEGRSSNEAYLLRAFLSNNSCY